MYHWTKKSVDQAPAAERLPAGKRSKKSKKSEAEKLFAEQLARVPNLTFVQQLHFAKTIKRRWRFDFAFPEFKVAVEIDGVVMKQIGGKWFTMGRHADVTGMRGDCMKGNAAIMYGWAVLHFLQDEIKPERALTTTLRVLALKGWKKS